ncbi:MAG: hypothetical protein BGO54_12585 [Sphingobacteriales bacterium 46-32]|nr:hypothetical protein [Chitinophagaceae bacterium]OJW36657.1 MAG: hypothetical protein BGO54_12585 [Sphingobacteriales bacterium 46-32]
MEYTCIYKSACGSEVELHPLHGNAELSENILAASILADHGHDIQLLPTFPEAEGKARQTWLPDVAHRKNPDIRIDNRIIGDIKTPNPEVLVKQSTINHCIYSCAQQKVAVAVINLLNRDYAIQDVKKGIVGALQPARNKSIRSVWIITAGRNLFKAERGMIFDETLYEHLILL